MVGCLNVPSGAISGGKGGRGRSNSGGGGVVVGDVCDAAARGRGDAGEALVELAELGLHALDGGPAGLLRVLECGVEDDVVAPLEHPTAGDALLLLLAARGRAEDRKVVLVFVGVGVGVGGGGSDGSSSSSSHGCCGCGCRCELAKFVDIHGIIFCDVLCRLQGGWDEGASLLGGGSLCFLLSLFDRVGEGAVRFDDLVDRLGTGGAGDGDRGPCAMGRGVGGGGSSGGTGAARTRGGEVAGMAVGAGVVVGVAIAIASSEVSSIV